MYLLQNVFGALRSLMQIILIVIEGKYEGEMIDMSKGTILIRSKLIDFIKNILDIFVANYYIHKPAGKAGKIGVIGTITSLIGIGQSLKLV